MAATDAKAVPVKNSAYRITFPILDADGDLVSGATGLDSEVSIDGAAFADCTNEATEIATSSGMYYLDLTASEMNGDTIAILVKTSSSGAKTTPIVLYTAARSINDIATQSSVDAVDNFIDTEIADIQARLPAALVGGRMDCNMQAAANDVITSSVLAASAITEIQSGLSTLDAAGIRTAVGLAAANLDTQLTAIDDYLDTEVAAIYNRIGAPAGASIAADVAAIKAETASIQTDTNDIQARLPAALVGGRMDSNASAINNDATSAANLAKTTRAIGRGTVTTGGTTTSIPTSAFTPASASAVIDQFKGRIVTFDADTTTAALRGQSTDITANTAGATPTFTVTALTTAPASGDTFSVT